MALLAARGIRVTLLTATRGEAGDCGDAAAVPSRGAARAQRRAEADFLETIFKT